LELSCGEMKDISGFQFQGSFENKELIQGDEDATALRSIYFAIYQWAVLATDKKNYGAYRSLMKLNRWTDNYEDEKEYDN
jgi:hypothetical protein